VKLQGVTALVASYAIDAPITVPAGALLFSIKLLMWIDIKFFYRQ